MPKIMSCELVGEVETYDLEVEHPDHQFYLSNGLLTSNSHAVSYALNSYNCAWLLRHFEPEWLCAYVEYTLTKKPEDRIQALAEIKSFGYKISRVDINLSDTNWTIGENKTFVPSFKSVKNVGDAAISEILMNRPYTSIENLLWDENKEWKHSKFNKRSLEHLIKVGAFDSMDIIGPGKTFDHYKHMYDVIIGNYDALKKKKGPEKLSEFISATRGGEDWSNLEKANFYKELIGEVNIDFYVPQRVQDKLTEKGVQCIDDLETSDIAWFIICDAVVKKTKAAQKEYLLLDVMGLMGKIHKMYCWGADKNTVLDINTPYVGQIKKDKFGLSTNLKQIRKIG